MTDGRARIEICEDDFLPIFYAVRAAAAMNEVMPWPQPKLAEHAVAISYIAQGVLLVHEIRDRFNAIALAGALNE